MKIPIITSIIMVAFFQLKAQSWEENQKIVVSDRAVGDHIGTSLSISGKYLILGTQLEDEDVSGQNTLFGAGSAYIFGLNSEGNWEELQKIVPSDRAFDDRFGGYLSISGNTAIITAYQEDEDASGANTQSEAGSAYIYTRDSSGVWAETQKIVAGDRMAKDWFGISVSVSGSYAIVGAKQHSLDLTLGNYLPKSGAAYIFERDSSGTWNQVQKIVAADRSENAEFGTSVSISGNYAIVGARHEAKNETGLDSIYKSGSAYIFERDNSGIWNQVQKINASDRSINDQFGFSVSISGEEAIVGAWQQGDDSSGGNTLYEPGAAYIFERNMSGVWNQAEKLVANDRMSNDNFGFTVSIDKGYAVVGVWGNYESFPQTSPNYHSGSAYIYKRSEQGTWAQIQKIEPSPKTNFDWFGFDVAIEDSTIMVGAWGEDEDSIGQNPVNDAGAVYSYQLAASTTIPELNKEAILKFHPNPTSGKLEIEFDKLYAEIDVRVFNNLGQLILTNHYFNSDQIGFKIEAAPGIYFVELSLNKKGYIRLKILKS